MSDVVTEVLEEPPEARSLCSAGIVVRNDHAVRPDADARQHVTEWFRGRERVAPRSSAPRQRGKVAIDVEEVSFR
jgi:hypothetical protein